MQTLKIIKLQEGVFKLIHNNNLVLYNTEGVILNVDSNSIYLESEKNTNIYGLSDIQIFDVNAINPLPISSIDDFVMKLNDLGYPLLNNKSESSSAGGTSSDKELVVTTYSVKTAFTGASEGDTVTATQVIDVAGTPTTVSTIWRNQTTGADLSSAPSADNLMLLGSQSLTDAQLRAAAIAVETPLPVDPFVGQLKIVTSSTAVGLPNKLLKNGIVLKASSSNTSNLFVGASGVTTTDDGTGNGYKLEPGEAISFAILNSNTIYVNGTAGSILYYSGN